MELEEIEVHVRQSQYVRTAVVIPYQPNGPVEYLIAAIVPENMILKRIPADKRH